MELTINSFRFILQAKEKIKLPRETSGSTLRGAFGYKLKEVSCQFEDKDCKNCSLKSSCAYFNLFIPQLHGKEKYTKENRLKTKPRPYIFQERINREILLPGDKFSFTINLFGKNHQYIPYIINAWKKLQNEGIGPTRGQFILKKVKESNLLTGEEHQIYSEFTREINRKMLSVDSDSIGQYISNIKQQKKVDFLIINFQTPVQLIVNSQLVKENINFYKFMRVLFRRLSDLGEFYGEKPNIYFDDYLEKAKEIQVKNKEIKKVSWKRKSKGKVVNMKGITGFFAVKGEIKNFLLYLIYGKLTNLGKYSTFGLGNYNLLWE